MERALFRFPDACERSAAVESWLGAQRGELGAIGRTWYRRLRQCGDDVRELMHDGCPTACVGEAAFAYVGVFTHHVSIGFFHGAALPDPAGLLRGGGKYMRHVKLTPGPLVDSPDLEALVAAAYRDVQARLEDSD